MKNDGSDLGVSVREALDDLDLGSPDQVADVLRWYGATGERYEPQSCPLARYLHLRTGDTSMKVGSMWVWSDNPDNDVTTRTTWLPYSAYAFRQMFDGGGFSDLMERPA